MIIPAGCNKRCEEFNDGFVKWLPYQVKDEILLTDSTKIDTFFMKVTYREITHTDKIPRLATCMCEDSYTVGLSSDTLHISLHFAESRNFKNSMVHVNEEYFFYYEHLDSCEISGREYYNVIEYIRNQEDQNLDPDKVFIARSVGIIYLMISGEIWKIVDDSKKDIDPAGIKKTIVDC